MRHVHALGDVDGEHRVVGTLSQGDDVRPLGRLPREGARQILGPSDRPDAAVAAIDLLAASRLRPHLDPVGGQPSGEEGGDPLDGGEPPLLLVAGGNREVRGAERRRPVGAGRPRARGDSLAFQHGFGMIGRHVRGHQPTLPSIWSSMSRLSSRAYSMGSSRAMGSTKPRTTIAIASSSDSPRC